jgi:hypothetical protein
MLGLDTEQPAPGTVQAFGGTWTDGMGISESIAVLTHLKQI